MGFVWISFIISHKQFLRPLGYCAPPLEPSVNLAEKSKQSNKFDPNVASHQKSTTAPTTETKDFILIECILIFYKIKQVKSISYQESKFLIECPASRACVVKLCIYNQLCNVCLRDQLARLPRRRLGFDSRDDRTIPIFFSRVEGGRF